MYGIYQVNAYQGNILLEKELDMFLFCLLDDIVSNSARSTFLNHPYRVVKSFENTNLQEQKNLNNIKSFISFDWDSVHPLNSESFSSQGFPEVKRVYNIRTNVVMQDTDNLPQQEVNEILDSLTAELRAPYTYTVTINGNQYSCPLDQNRKVSRVNIPADINQINYYVGVLALVFTITKLNSF